MAQTLATQEYPFGTPTVTGTQVSIDTMLQQPTRITRYLSDIMLQRFFMDRIFTPVGNVTGGGLLVDVLDVNDLYTDRDVQFVEPGAEFPIVGMKRSAPVFVAVDKFGGKFPITDEARDRNDQRAFQRQATMLGNTMTKRVNTIGLSALDAAVTAYSQTAVGNNWSNIVTAGTSAASNSAYPAADFAKVQLGAEQDELGIVYDTWIVNPQEMANFQIVYGDSWAQVLQTWNVEMIPTNRVAAGTAYVVEAGQVGVMGVEKPVSTETWRRPENQETWTQTDGRFAFAVDNPYAVTKVTGLAG